MEYVEGRKEGRGQYVLSWLMILRWWCEEDSCYYSITMNINPRVEKLYATGCRWFRNSKKKENEKARCWLGWTSTWIMDGTFILLLFDRYSHRVPFNEFVKYDTVWWKHRKPLGPSNGVIDYMLPAWRNGYEMVRGYEMVMIPPHRCYEMVMIPTAWRQWEKVGSPKVEMAAEEYGWDAVVWLQWEKVGNPQLELVGTAAEEYWWVHGVTSWSFV